MSRANQIWANVETGLAYPINTTSVITSTITGPANAALTIQPGSGTGTLVETFNSLTGKAGAACTISPGASGTLIESLTSTGFVDPLTMNIDNSASCVVNKLGAGNFYGCFALSTAGLQEWAICDTNSHNFDIVRAGSNTIMQCLAGQDVVSFPGGITPPTTLIGNIFSLASAGGSVANNANFVAPTILCDSISCIGNQVSMSISVSGTTTATSPPSFIYTLPASLRSTNFSTVSEANGCLIANDGITAVVVSTIGAKTILVSGAASLTTGANFIKGVIMFTRN